MRLGRFRLFLDGFHPTGGVEAHDAVALRIGHVVGEHGGALGVPVRLLQQRSQPGAVEDVVAQDQRRGVLAHELAPDDERLRQTLGLGLLGVAHVEPQPRAIAEQRAKPRHVLWSRDQQHVADAREHQRRKRIVHERLVVHRHQLLRGAERERVEARAGAAGEDDAFSHSRGSV